MTKKTLILAAMFVCAFAISASAEILSIQVEYAADDLNIVNISGDSTLPGGSGVTVSVFESSKSYADIIGEGEDVSDILLFAGKVQAQESGEWSALWKPSQSMDCDIYVSDGDTIFKKSFFIAAQKGDDYNLMRSADESTLKSFFANPLKERAWLTDIVNSEKVGQALYQIREFTSNAESVFANLEAASAMVRLSEKQTAEALDAVLETFAVIDIVPTGADEYEKLATKEIKTEMALNLAEVFENPLSSFDEIFSEELVLSGIYRSTNYMDAVEFLKFSGLVSSEKNLKKAAKVVVGKKYTYTALERAVKSAVSESSSGGSTGGSSGGSSSGRGTVTVVTPVVTEPVETQENKEYQVFSDVEKTHWAYNVVGELYHRQIVSGTDSGLFYPDKEVTRAEFLKMLCEAYDIKGAQTSVAFDDVAENDWFYPYVCAASAQSLVMGDETGRFRPNDSITREDAAVLLYRFAVSNKTELAGGEEVFFSDSGDIAEYAQEAVKLLSQSGLVSGMGNGMFSPKAKTTRAQAAAMIYNASIS
ncbi:MAG: S-layer homology domain-containing protein [Clostridia bacterium]|nr:S-layer homology domain-containing protein [Clostridia bacterium]